jgi:hypothetical protein
MKRTVVVVALLVLLVLAGCGGAPRSAVVGTWRTSAARPAYVYVFGENRSVSRSPADASGSTEKGSYSETIADGSDVIRISGLSGGDVFATMASPDADVIDIQGVRYFREGSAAANQNTPATPLESRTVENGKRVIYLPSLSQCTGACRLVQ